MNRPMRPRIFSSNSNSDDITANPKDWMTAWASAALPRTLNRPAMINIEVEAKKVVELT